jgi:hypothetical protein
LYVPGALLSRRPPARGPQVQYSWYSVEAKGARPYIDGGPTFDTPAGLKQTFARLVIPTRISTTTATSNPPELNNNTTAGVVVGLGLDVHALGFPALLVW